MENRMTDIELPEKLLKPQQVADILGIEELTLATWRCSTRSRPLPFVRVGGAVRYRPSDVQRFIDSNTEPAKLAGSIAAIRETA